MKLIKKLLFITLILLFSVDGVNASTASMNLSSNKSTAIVGTKVDLTLKISTSGVPLGGWEYNIKYDSSKLSLISGETFDKDVVSAKNQYNKYAYLSFKVIGSGSARVYLNAGKILDYNEKEYSVSLPSVTINCMTQSQLEATYSKNNNLSKLSIDGFELDKEFNKDTLEYNLEVENKVETIVINATKQDSTASIRGNGTIELEEGINTLNVVVTAQNGQEKTYVIKVTRKELDPINVTINGKDYSIIRKEKLLEQPSEIYELKTIIIDDKEVPAYYNEELNYTIVGLKDANGDINYYLYDNGKYELYQQLTFSDITIRPIDKEVFDYKKTTVTINKQEVSCYKYNETSRFCYMYGINIEKQKKSLYQYDNLENTIQRYNDEVIQDLNTNINSKTKIMFVFMTTTLLFMFLLILVLISKIKKTNKRNNCKEKNIDNIIVETKTIQNNSNEPIDEEKIVEVKKSKKGNNYNSDNKELKETVITEEMIKKEKSEDIEEIVEEDN